MAAPMPGLAALPHGLGHVPDGNGDDRQIDGFFDFRDQRIGRQPLDFLILAVNRVNFARKAVPEEIAHQGLPDGLVLLAGADHRHRGRFEK